MEQFIIVFNEELVVDGSKNSYSTELRFLTQFH